MQVERKHERAQAVLAATQTYSNAKDIGYFQE